MSFTRTHSYPDCTCSRHHRGTSPLAAAHRFGRRPYARLVPVLVALLGLWLLDAPSSLAQDLVPEPMHLAVTSAESAEVLVDLSSPMTHAFSSTAKWKGYLEFLGKPGTARSLGQPDLFLPVLQDINDMTFLNIRGQLQFDNTDNSETNIGLGHRHMFQEWILGGYGYFDRRNTQYGSHVNQFTGGLEAMSVDWGFRVNGYLPESQTTTFTGDASVSVVRPSDQIHVQIDGIVQEKALPGLDGEVGYLLPIPWEAYTSVFDETRVYAGGYHFFGEDQFDSVTGPRGRLEMRAYDLPVLGPGSRFMMGVEAQWDEPRGSQAFGLFSLRIPFDVFSDKSKRKRLNGLNRRMLQPVIRDVDVVTSEFDVPTETVAALNPAGEAYESAEDLSLDDYNVVTHDGGVRVRFIKSNGGIVDDDDFRSPGENETVANGGTELLVGYESKWLGAGKVGYTPNGTPFTLQAAGCNPGNNAVVVLNPGSHLNGMFVDGDSNCNWGFRLQGGGPGSLAAYVTNTTVRNAARSGIRVEDSGVLYIRDSTFENNVTSGEHDHGGLLATDGPGDGGIIYADNVKLLNNGSMGAYAASAGYIEITNSTISGNFNHGLSAEGGGTIIAKGVVIEDNNKVGVDVHAREGLGGHIEISDSIVRRNGTGFVANDLIDAVIIADNVLVTENDTHGVATFNDSQIIIKNSRIIGNGTDGVRGRDDSQISITNSLIANNGRHGVHARESATVDIKDSLITGNGYHGLHAESYYGAVDMSHPIGEDEHHDPASTLTATNVTVAGNGGYGVVNRGGQVTINGSDFFGNGSGDYLNQIGVSEQIDNPEWVDFTNPAHLKNDHCIRANGVITVNGQSINPTVVVPIAPEAHCDGVTMD